MTRAIYSGAVAGVLSALAVAALEAARGAGASFGLSWAAGAGLLAPVGLAIGTALIAARAMLPKEHRPAALVAALASRDNPRAAARIGVVPIFSLAAIALIHRVVLFFLTGFHHHGLAALALTASLLALFAALSIAAGRLARGAEALIARMPLALRRPSIHAVVAAAAWAFAIVPPLVEGPQAKGPWGFVGLLRKDGLGAAPLVHAGAIALAAGALLSLLLRRERGWLPFAASVALVAAVLGPFAASRIVGTHPEVLDRLDSSGGAAQLIGKLCRRAADRDGDGHAAWMGGRDCDDGDARVHPGAREIVDNGVDEDCDGADLLSSTLAEAKEAQAKSRPKDVAAAPPRRPDLPDDVSLFLITIDSLRWNAPGFMGAKRDVTPNLDDLVAGGTVYDRAYALGSYTGQAIPSMLTGKYASELHRNNRHETKISAREETAAEYVCRDGVKCKGVMSHFLFDRQFGWTQGFDEWSVAAGLPPDQTTRDLRHTSSSVADAAIEWLSVPENTAGRFWLWTHFMDPHKEYIEHPGFELFGDDRRDMYDHEVLYTDHHVGRMLARFRDLPAAKRTVIIVTADHGEAFNEHGRLCHGKELWEEIIRVPFAVVGPGVAAKRIARQTSQIDLFATILDLFGVEPPAGGHGRSLLPDWVEGQETPARPVVADQPRNPYYEARRVFIWDGWKLHDLPDSGTHRLYRLTDDYERGESLVESEPEAFARIKAAYDLFVATELEPMAPVDYTDDYRYMPLPR